MSEIKGTRENDAIVGTASEDTIVGLSGDDTIRGDISDTGSATRDFSYTNTFDGASVGDHISDGVLAQRASGVGEAGTSDAIAGNKTLNMVDAYARDQAAQLNMDPGLKDGEAFQTLNVSMRVDMESSGNKDWVDGFSINYGKVDNYVATSAGAEGGIATGLVLRVSPIQNKMILVWNSNKIGELRATNLETMDAAKLTMAVDQAGKVSVNFGEHAVSGTIPKNQWETVDQSDYGFAIGGRTGVNHGAINIDDVEITGKIHDSSHESGGAADRILGGEGADRIEGMAGADLLAGDVAGSEWKSVDGKWVYEGTATGADTEDGTALDEDDSDVILGGSGDDVLLGADGEDELDGGSGDDVINAGRHNDVAHGGDGNDTLNLEHGDDVGYGGEGDDTINAGIGDDTAYGGAGNDKLNAGSGNDTMYGDAGKDTLHGSDGDDTLHGGDGDDKVFGGNDNDTLTGGAGKDHLDGGSGNDMISGGDGNDLALGGAGDDHISGGAGSDKLVGGSGSDVIESGAGNDHLWGGNWRGDNATDTFVVSAGTGKDILHDFETAHDQIDLSSYGLEFGDIQSVMSDRGWATEIDLSSLSGGQSGDKLLLKSVKVEDLDESNFIL